MVSGGSYTYQTGPDGKSYAVAGEVSISASYSGSPQERLHQAETVRRAALAPADPSPQDRQVAAQAAAVAFQARTDIRAEQRLEMAEKAESSKADRDNEQNSVSVLSRRAITSFTGLSCGANLHSNPSTIDEII
jgi:hypothetical protein